MDTFKTEMKLQDHETCMKWTFQASQAPNDAKPWLKPTVRSNGDLTILEIKYMCCQTCYNGEVYSPITSFVQKYDNKHVPHPQKFIEANSAKPWWNFKFSHWCWDEDVQYLRLCTHVHTQAGVERAKGRDRLQIKLGSIIHLLISFMY